MRPKGAFIPSHARGARTGASAAPGGAGSPSPGAWLLKADYYVSGARKRRHGPGQGVPGNKPPPQEPHGKHGGDNVRETYRNGRGRRQGAENNGKRRKATETGKNRPKGQQRAGSAGNETWQRMATHGNACIACDARTPVAARERMRPHPAMPGRALLYVARTGSKGLPRPHRPELALQAGFEGSGLARAGLGRFGSDWDRPPRTARDPFAFVRYAKVRGQGMVARVRVKPREVRGTRG
jgi:hypothetical protein